ncbi:MarR family transcriptional regulator [Aliisedimentitalea scapharcae]|uniref:MarR family transcriptional regulator n=1 Tax=Aliisedimentitalea scapharcae TaxID=1524259 RepID=A0ABZ2XQV0_9RHOB
MTQDELDNAVLDIPLQEMVTFRISRTHARLSAQAAQLLKKTSGISLMQWRVFVMLEVEGRITPAEIVRRTDLDKSQLSRTIKSMVADGLLTSEPSESDQRAHVLEFTAKGFEVFQQARPHMRHRQARLLNSLTDDERGALFDALAKLDSAVEDLENDI